MNQQSHPMTTPSFNKKRLIVALFAMAGLLVSTHIPQKYMPVSLNRFDLDKLLHLFAYGVLAGLMILAIKPPRGLITKLGVLIALILLAIADECTQAFVGRSASIADLQADIIGILIAMTLTAASHGYVQA